MKKKENYFIQDSGSIDNYDDICKCSSEKCIQPCARKRIAWADTVADLAPVCVSFEEDKSGK